MACRALFVISCIPDLAQILGDVQVDGSHSYVKELIAVAEHPPCKDVMVQALACTTLYNIAIQEPCKPAMIQAGIDSAIMNVMADLNSKLGDNTIPLPALASLRDINNVINALKQAKECFVDIVADILEKGEQGELFVAGLRCIANPKKEKTRAQVVQLLNQMKKC